MRPEVTVIGADGAGAAIAKRIAGERLASVAVLDLEGRAPRELVTRMEALGLMVLSRDEFEKTADSQVFVITAGDTPARNLPDDELLKKNEETVRKCVALVTRHSRDLTIIVGTEPMDAMCEVARRVSRLPGKRIIGLPARVERRRMSALVAREQGVLPSGVLNSFRQTGPVPLVEAADELAGFATEIVDALLNDKRTVHICAGYLEGEYGVNGVFAAVPAVVGKNGIERVIELTLSQEESNELWKSAAGVAKLLLKLTP